MQPYTRFIYNLIHISLAWYFSTTPLSLLASIIFLYWQCIAPILCTIEKCIPVPDMLLWYFYNSQKEQLPPAATHSACSWTTVQASVAGAIHSIMICIHFSLLTITTLCLYLFFICLKFKFSIIFPAQINYYILKLLEHSE